MSDEAPTKVCKCCGLAKPADDFAVNAKGKFGRRSTCRICTSAKSLAKRMAVSALVNKRVGCMNPDGCQSKGHNLCNPCASKELMNRDGFVEWRASLRFPDEKSKVEHGRKVSARYEDPEFWRRASVKATQVNLARYGDAANSERIRRAIGEAKRMWHERRRENEEFEAFMARIECEALEAEDLP